MPLTYMPISLTMKGRKCLVVGGGAVALRKVETLLDYDTEITVIAPEAVDKLKSFAERQRIILHHRTYESPEAGSYELVISAADDMAVNKQVSEDARKAGVLVNVADQPALCDFIFPAVLRRDVLTAAISTDGKAPFMSGHLKTILDGLFPPHWNKLMEQAVRFRKMAMDRWADDLVQKTACYTRFVEADWKELLKIKNPEEFEAEIEKMLAPGPIDVNKTDEPVEEEKA